MHAHTCRLVPDLADMMYVPASMNANARATLINMTGILEVKHLVRPAIMEST